MSARRGGATKAAKAIKVEAPGARRPAPTVAIHHPVDPNRPTVIPKADFDPKTHKLWQEPSDAVVDAGAADKGPHGDTEDESGSSVR